MKKKIDAYEGRKGVRRLATSRPLGEQSEPCLAAKRPTASDEVARGRLVSLDGFSFAFRAKNGEWRDLHLGFGFHLRVLDLNGRIRLSK